MGKTFVYNIPFIYPPPPGILEITCGLFFDGTRNNRRNTEIRKKVQGIDEYKDIPASQEEREIYEKYGESNDSYGSDFTNVARKYMCCEKDIYAVYVEGIGTVDEEGDSISGSAWGRGSTGIIEKVRSGCRQLAKRIKEAAKNKNQIKTITVTVDVFGFSRGAAAARNFLYNLQKKAYTPEVFYPPVQGAPGIKIDHSGYSVKESWLKDGQLPPFGHLGTSLLEAGIQREMIEKLRISVRFLGIYDTAASYNPYSLSLSTDFKKHIGELHLHELGRFRRAVHFTAMDEHRENFSLTRLEAGKAVIEKEFPGAHSDVGGSYNTEPEIIKDIENSGYQPYEKLEQYRQELVKGHWYKEDQIRITDKFGNIVTFGGISRKLRGERFLKKEYSFIPLHFMRDHSLDLMEKYYIEGKIDKDYSIEGDEFLEAAKKYLRPYVMGEEGAEKWTFISDKQLEQRKQKHKKDLEQEEQPEESPDLPPDEPLYKEIELKEVIIYHPQALLRILRNQYLHWSAKREGIGMDPDNDYKRREF
jgi:hypothetical protein